MGNKYLRDDEEISDATTLGTEILFYVNPKTRRIETAWYRTPIGIGEWDFNEQTFVPLDSTDTRAIKKWPFYAVYMMDWKNKDFDVMEAYEKRELTEELLKEHALLVHDEFGGSGDSGSERQS